MYEAWRTYDVEYPGHLAEAIRAGSGVASDDNKRKANLALFAVSVNQEKRKSDSEQRAKFAREWGLGLAEFDAAVEEVEDSSIRHANGWR